MKKIVLFSVSVLSIFLTAKSQTFVSENFAYLSGQLTSASAGANVSGGNWVTVSGTTAFVPVVTGNLTYPSYINSGTGSMINLIGQTASGGEDVRRGFLDQTTPGQTIASFLCRVSNRISLGGSTTNGDYFAHFTNITGTGGGFHSRIYIRSSGNGVNFGLQTNSAGSFPIVWDPITYDTNVTHLIVVSYEIVAGANNDTGRLWINPPLAASAPSPNLIQAVTTGTEPDGIDAFGLRQSYSTSTLIGTCGMDIDGLRVGKTWAHTALPVSWSSFNASNRGKQIKLTWSTNSEINNGHFEVERSTDANVFETIGQVKGNGNSSVTNHYVFIDEQPLAGVTYYRIKQVDFDGQFSYSDVREVNNERITPVITSPNPFQTTLTLQLNNATQVPTSIELVDLTGKVRYYHLAEVTEVNPQFQLSVADLPAGIYFVRVSNSTDITIHKVVKQ